MSDLSIALTALSAKERDYTELWRYYDGHQPVKYSIRRLHKVFKAFNIRFTQNWCSVVVDSVNDRLQLEALRAPGNEQADESLNEIWSNTELNISSDETHLAALVIGESYVIAWPDENGNPQAFYNDPRMVHLWYDPDNPNVPIMGAKWWVVVGGGLRLNLYYTDRIEQYQTTNAFNKSFINDVKNADVKDAAVLSSQVTKDSFVLVDSIDNPYGIVPIFHFMRERRRVISELASVLPLQDAINKLLADMMVSAEFAAYPMRYIIGSSDTSDVKIAPNTLIELPSSDGESQNTQVGQLPAANLDNYLKPIGELANSIGIITRTPRHFFFLQGGNVSGEALIAMEAPLSRKVQRYQDVFTSTWKRLASFLLLIDGQEVDRTDIRVVYQEVATIQPLTRAQIRQADAQAGIPITNQLRREGATQDEIDQLLADRVAEAAAQAQLSTALLDQARRGFDQGG